MSELESLSARIDALEVRIAYQDETIETLNSTITDQWKRIDDLGRQISLLESRSARPRIVHREARRKSHRITDLQNVDGRPAAFSWRHNQGRLGAHT